MLCILRIERLKRTKNIETWAYCFCNIYNRFDWVRVSNIKNKSVTTGRHFFYRELDSCIDINDYLNQFVWQKDNKGYIYRNFKGKRIYQHKEVWTLLKGEISENLFIDHIDRNKSNNDISNLRLATISQNSLNRTFKSDKNNMRHISYLKDRRKYRVRIQGKHYGYFNSLEKARKVRNKIILSHSASEFLKNK